MVICRYRRDLGAHGECVVARNRSGKACVGEGERMGMDARITDGSARTNGRRPGHVDMITDSERPAADPSADPPTHRVAVVPRPRVADGGRG